MDRMFARGCLLSLFLLGLQVASVVAENYLEKFSATALSVSLRNEAVYIAYNCSSLAGSSQWVEVEVQGVQHPKVGDIIAAFSPPGAYAHGAAPVKYENLSAAAGSYLNDGTAHIPVRLVNLRADVQFVFIRGGLEAPVVAAEGPVLCNAAPNEPTGIHLLLGRDPTEMRVQWSTRDAGQPAVRYGLTPTRLEYTAPATTATYAAADLCGAPGNAEGWLDPGSLHTATLSGLRPGRRYFYSVGDAMLRVASPVHSFLAHPGVGPGVEVHLLAVADQGVGEPDHMTAAMEYAPALRVAESMAADVARGVAHESGAAPYSLVLHNGDVSYARGYGALWDTWLLQQAPVLTALPIVTAIGNHERDWLEGSFYSNPDSGGECGVPYAHRFPGYGSGPDRPWYSFLYGPVHFVYMSTEHDFMEGSLQHRWLQAELSSTDRSRTPWLVLVGHRPIYIDAADFDPAWPGGKQETAIQLQASLDHLINQHGVDVALAGHHHSYQRTCPVHEKHCKYDQKGRPAATVHICHGHGGADLYANGFDPRPSWVEAETSLLHGHLRVHANGTHLRIQAVNSATGSTHDELLLTKQPDIHGGTLRRSGSALFHSQGTAAA